MSPIRNKFFAVFVISSFLLVSFYSIGMGLTHKGGCLFLALAGEGNACVMGVVKHIATWQEVFTSLPGFSVFLGLAFLFLAAVFIGFNDLSQKPVFAGQERFFKKRNDFLKPLNSISVAFRKGILHSKVYAN